MQAMLLAEALAERADLHKRLGSLRARLQENVYADGESSEPLESPESLLSMAEKAVERLEQLLRNINATNTQTPFHACGVSGTLTDALARRDALASLHKTLAEALEGVGTRRRRYFDERPASKVVIDVAEWRARMDSVAKDLRQLDLAIQSLNWQTELIEQRDTTTS